MALVRLEARHAALPDKASEVHSIWQDGAKFGLIKSKTDLIVPAQLSGELRRQPTK